MTYVTLMIMHITRINPIPIFHKLVPGIMYFAPIGIKNQFPFRIAHGKIGTPKNHLHTIRGTDGRGAGIKVEHRRFPPVIAEDVLFTEQPGVIVFLGG
ncbi:MAG: hypothetical protein NXI25_20360 [bacterium]|nr:hypothetical protein [bacterium]